jgi:hypothetical protein
MRRSSDTKLISKGHRYGAMQKRNLLHRSLPPSFLEISRQKQVSGNDCHRIWEGPEEVIRGRLIAQNGGFLPESDTIRLMLNPTKRKRLWQRDILDLIDCDSGRPYAGGARIQLNPNGFYLLTMSNKVVVKCFEEFNPKTQQHEYIICSTISLTDGDEQCSNLRGFYRWFKVSVDESSHELSLDLWSGTQYYPLWYAEHLKKGQEIYLKSISDDEDVGKLVNNEIFSFAGIDPAVMICLGVAVQRLPASSCLDGESKDGR